MTPFLPAIKADQVVKVARQLGFAYRRQKGSHAIYYRENDKARIVIPMHAGKDIKPKTLHSIISDMGITVDEFKSLL